MIDYIQLFGLQTSGTNAIENLLRANFDVEIGMKHGAKHGLNFKIDEGDAYSNVLFVYIQKDILAWVCSVKDSPHEAMPKLLLGQAIRQPWVSANWDFPNIVQMRKQIIADYDKIENQVDHWVNLKHDWLFFSPENILRSLHSKYGLPLVGVGFDVSSLENYKGQAKSGKWKGRDARAKYYLNKEYILRLHQRDIDFIMSYNIAEDREWLKI